MLGLIALLIIFMVRNGKKRQKAMQELQAGLIPGAEVILQPGIFATVEEIDEDEQRLTVRSGSSSFVVHRNMVAQLVPVYAEAEETETLAPDDDPAFGERFSEAGASGISEEASNSSGSDDVVSEAADSDDAAESDTDQPDSGPGEESGDNRSA